ICHGSLLLRGGGLALENHDRDLAIGPSLVVVVGWPHRRHQIPQPSSLSPFRSVSADRDSLPLDLDRRLRMRLEVLVPIGMVGRAALGRDNHPRFVIAAIDQRRRPLLPRRSSRRGQEQDRRATPVVPLLATSLLVHPYVLLAKWVSAKRIGVLRHATSVAPVEVMPAGSTRSHRREPCS